jgi:uncharacterized protein YeaO (DUF488 family)
MVKLKRAYEAPSAADGARVLVERLWPRGVRKADAALDAWLKELAPSDALRKWFAHDPDRFREFRARYERELRSPEARELIADLAKKAERGTVTLVYAAHDEEHNSAVVLARTLARRRPSARRARRSDRPPRSSRR